MLNRTNPLKNGGTSSSTIRRLCLSLLLVAAAMITVGIVDSVSVSNVTHPAVTRAQVPEVKQSDLRLIAQREADLRHIVLPGAQPASTPGAGSPSSAPAVWLHRPHISGNSNLAESSNWSGQIDEGATYTGVYGDWTVPTIVPSTGAEYSSSWIGIDGATTSSLIQTGTGQDTSGGGTTYYAWYELLPGGEIVIPSAPVSPGDQMQASVVETALNTWTITIADVTASWSASGALSYVTPGTSVEWIEEATTVGSTIGTLADYGSTTFTTLQIQGTNTGSALIFPVYMVGPVGDIISYPGAFNSSTDSFPVTYGTPRPVVTSVSPSQGGTSGGTGITISGNFFDGAIAVDFGTNGAGFSPGANGTIDAVSPSQGAGSVDVTVTTPGGTSLQSSVDLFTYQSPAPPTTTTTSPPSPPPAQHGYWLVGGDGGIFTFGSAQFHGSTGSLRLQRPVVGITPTQSHGGYWLDASDGGIFSFGDAGFYGSVPGIGLLPAGTPGNVRRLNAPVVGMVPSTDGGGYFMVASDGGVFAFGDAKFEGSCPGMGGCSGPAVAVMPDASGNGYWLVTATGHVYTFGDATYFGSPGPIGTVTSAVRSPDGNGYLILFSDGVVAPFGDAASLGSLPGGATGSVGPASAIFSTGDGGGYWVGTADGAVYPFGDAPSDGSMLGMHLNAPIIAGVGW
jgi:hypothetical protein